MMTLLDLINRVRSYTRDTTETLFDVDDIKDFINEGIDRLRSIKHGFVKDICRLCHDDEEKILELRKEVQSEFEETHTREEFIQLIGWSYLKD